MSWKPNIVQISWSRKKIFQKIKKNKQIIFWKKKDKFCSKPLEKIYCKINICIKSYKQASQITPVIVIKQNFLQIKSMWGINKKIKLFSPCYSYLLLTLSTIIWFYVFAHCWSSSRRVVWHQGLLEFCGCSRKDT